MTRKRSTGITRKVATGITRAVSTGIRRKKGEQVSTSEEQQKSSPRTESLHEIPITSRPITEEASRPSTQRPEPLASGGSSGNKRNKNWIIIAIVAAFVLLLGGIIAVANRGELPPQYATAVSCDWQRTITVSEPVLKTEYNWLTLCGGDCRVVEGSCELAQSGTRQEEIPGTGRWAVVGSHYEDTNCRQEQTGTTPSCSWEDTNCGWVEGTCSWEDTNCGWEDTGDGNEEYICDQEYVCDQEYICIDVPEYSQVCDQILVEDRNWIVDHRTVPVYDQWCKLERTEWIAQMYVSEGNDLPASDPVYEASNQARIFRQEQYTITFQLDGEDRTLVSRTDNIEEFQCKKDSQYVLSLSFGRVISYTLRPE